MPTPRTIKVTDSEDFERTMDELADLLAEATDLPAQVAAPLLNLARDPMTAVRMQARTNTMGERCEVTIRAEPSDDLLAAVHALRRWNAPPTPSAQNG